MMLKCVGLFFIHTLAPAITHTCMETKTIRYGQFAHRYENEMFESLCSAAARLDCGTGGTLLVVGNINIGGADINACVAHCGGVVLFLFKNCTGSITLAEDQMWTDATGAAVEGGSGAADPYRQARLCVARAEAWLSRVCGRRVKVSACVVTQGTGHAYVPEPLKAEAWFGMATVGTLGEYLSAAVIGAGDADFDCGRLIDALRGGAAAASQGVDIGRDAVADSFADLESIPDDMPVQARYEALSRVLNNAVNRKLKGIDLKFTGLFAKIQYLIREYNIRENCPDNSLAIAINGVRNRMRNIADADAADLEADYAADFMAVCKFIAYINDRSRVPACLAAKFPKTVQRTFRRRMKDSQGEALACIRCSVDSWDSHYIYATRSDSGEETVVDYTTIHEFNLSQSWSYIAKLLRKGTQLNLVKPREQDGTIFPELIIFEPDYLVNVTSVAACFEEYGHSYKLNLINRIKPVRSTVPMLLGNFAGQMLDEASSGRNVSYADSLREFFRSNAIPFASIDDPQALAGFHDEARRQKARIWDFMNNSRIHQKDGSPISSGQLILEPSYFCETLGLQGRMDLIHLNLDTLVEQKSGKAAWPSRDGDVRQQQKHYVQLLLYRAIFHYAYGRVDYGHLASWLLYSRYDGGLIELGSAPQLLFEAVQTRNLIAWSEMLCAQSGMQIIETMSSANIFPGIDNTLFTRFHAPEIDSLLATVHSAGPLEKAYYYRFMRFIANEHVLSKVGNRTKEDSGFASMWNSTLTDKRQAGNIYEHLIMDMPLEQGRVETLRLHFDRLTDSDMSNFRVGDIVALYPYDTGGEPDATACLVFRGTITGITLRHIDIKLRNAQNGCVFAYIARDFSASRRKLAWAVEHDFMESSYSPLYRGMQAFLTADPSRRDLILCRRPPRTDTAITLSAHYGTEEFDSLVLHAKQAQDIYLIVGPPGTGKTSYGMVNVLTEHLATPGTSALLMAYTNRAVDEICSKLTGHGIDFIRIGSESGCSPEYRSYLLDNRIEAMPAASVEGVRRMVGTTRVFCGTTTAFNATPGLFAMKRFDIAIVDEASQILEPYIVGLMCARHGTASAIGKFVLIGDEKQLPAVVQQQPSESAVNDPLLNAISLTDCRLSLFERLLRHYGKTDESRCHVLTRQGRMHPAIAVFPNCTFYQNTLRPVPLGHQLEPDAAPLLGRSAVEDMLLACRVAFVACNPTHDPAEPDKVNTAEARVIAAVAVQWRKMAGSGFDAASSVGVIVPYRNQISTVRSAIGNLCQSEGIKGLDGITIDTVERYQGSQRDLIIYGFTAKRYYQLDFLTANEYFDATDGAVIDRKLNVAMTRARKCLVMVGCDSLLAHDITFYKLMEYCRHAKCFFRAGDGGIANGVPETVHCETGGDVNASVAAFAANDSLAAAYGRIVADAVKADATTLWPSLLFGNGREVNMNVIGYGRGSLAVTQRICCADGIVRDLSPRQQALLYCCYLMPGRYRAAVDMFAALRTEIEKMVGECGRRVVFADFGCGPATCGLAFFGMFGSMRQARYIGIDASEAMCGLGREFMQSQAFGGVENDFAGPDAIDEVLLCDAGQEEPLLRVFSFPFFFGRVSPDAAERLALRLSSIMRSHPAHRIVVAVQQSAADAAGCRPFAAFARTMAESVPSLARLHPSPGRAGAAGDVAWSVWTR